MARSIICRTQLDSAPLTEHGAHEAAPPGEAPLPDVESPSFQQELRRRIAGDGLRLVGGVDISAVHAPGEDAAANATPQRAFAGLAVLTFPALEVVFTEERDVTLTQPYSPGFLGFREVPHLLPLLESARKAGCYPQVVLCDGFGTLHQRGCGSASHLGVVANVPTIGVGKTLNAVDGLSTSGVRDMMRAALATDAAAPARDRGAKRPSEDTLVVRPLRGQSGRLLGAAMAGHAGSEVPLYVSVGHRVSLASAVEVVARCCRHRVPEPIRVADLRTRERAREAHAAPRAP
ncbi:unnamed protein product [Pedinophyceae sp. YPF-701]|nr:unnamed protein product [Pedinophyceae sp. YPF-701]